MVFRGVFLKPASPALREPLQSVSLVPVGACLSVSRHPTKTVPFEAAGGDRRSVAGSSYRGLLPLIWPSCLYRPRDFCGSYSALHWLVIHYGVL